MYCFVCASDGPCAGCGLWAPLWANTHAARVMPNAPAADVALHARGAGALNNALVANVYRAPGMLVYISMHLIYNN